MSSVGGTWSPSPVILYGVATHNFIPLLGNNKNQIQNVVQSSSGGSIRNDLKVGESGSGRKEAEGEGEDGNEEEQLNPHQVPLEIGDEVYVFEIFTPTPSTNSPSPHTQDEGIWYRGYVVTSASLTQPITELAYAVPSPPSFNSNLSQPGLLASTLSTEGILRSGEIGGLGESIPLSPVGSQIVLGKVTEEEPVVAIGIFPKSHIQIREQLEDAEKRLGGGTGGEGNMMQGGIGMERVRSTDSRGMETEEEEEDLDVEEVEIGSVREVNPQGNNTQGRLLNLSSVSEEGSVEGSPTSSIQKTLKRSIKLPKHPPSSINTNLSKSNSSLNSINSPTSPTSPQRPPPLTTSTSKSNRSLSNYASPPVTPTRMGSRTSVTSLASIARFSIVPLPSPRTASGQYGVKSLDEEGMIDNDPRPLAPIPNLKCGDETSSGLEEPLIDEIACTLREWSTLLHSHLFNKNYDLFAEVRNHIEVLHTGRRQLLAGSLSREEKVILRGKMVRRLVRGNREQGLDIIVRHPNWGGLVEGDGEALEERDRRNWVSGVRMYAMQVALAYSGVSNKNGLNSTHTILPEATIASTSNQRFSTPNLLTSSTQLSTSQSQTHSLAQSQSRSLPPIISTPIIAKFHHIFIDLKAFVANICVQGETAELYFSLFNKTESRYVTDEYCAILNHQGISASAKDLNSSTTTLNEGRMRTLFTGFSAHDVLDELFLVCRIVKNGSIKSIGENTAISSGLSRSNTLPASSNHHNNFNNASPIIANNTQSPNPQLLSPTTANTTGKFSATSFETASETGVDMNIGAPAHGMLSVDQNGRSTWRRPFGVAVLELNQFMKGFTNSNRIPDSPTSPNSSSSNTTQEHQMPIFVPTHETAFSTLHEDIINSRTKSIEKSPNAQHISVNVRVLYGSTPELINSNPSFLSKDIPLTPRLGFEDVVFPGTERNDCYLKLWSGDFTSTAGNGAGRGLSGIGNSSQLKNVEVSVEIRTRDGALVDRVIGRGEGEERVSSYTSMVFRANNNPTWGELVKLDIPVELIETCHAFFSFRSRGAKGTPLPLGSTIEKPFAFAYFPLFLDSTAFIPDGSHKLVLYKYEPNCATPQFYFQAPAILGNGELTPRLPLSILKTLIPLKDTMVLRSFLVSTTYTQNETLLKLLQWEKVLLNDLEGMKEVLTQVRFCSEVEVCKFLRDIFDALFNILESQMNQRGELDDLVFHALVDILAIVQDRRFANFKPVLDLYIERHFSSPLAYTHLMKALYRLLRDPGGAEAGTTLRSSLKVMNNLFHIIIRSRELQTLEEVRLNRPSEGVQANFKRELSRLLRQINILMQGPFPSSVIGAQTIAVHHFASILPDLAKCYNEQELADIAISFGDSVSEKGKIQIYKLLFINQLVNSKLFASTTSRAALVPRLVRWLKPALGRFDEQVMCGQNDTPAMRDTARVNWLEGIRLAVGVVASISDTLQEAMVDPAIRENRILLNQEQDNIEYLLGIISGLLESYREFESPASLESVERQRTQASIVSNIPVVFPSTYPFSLLSRNPTQTRLPLGSANIAATITHTPIIQNEERPTLRSGLGEIACVFLVLVSLAPRKIFVNFLEASLEIEGKNNFARQLDQVFHVSKSILVSDAYPSNWLNINIFAHRVLVNMLDPISEILEREFIPVVSTSETESNFDSILWKGFFGTLVKLLVSPQLLIEDFSPQKRRAVWRLGDDIRGRGAKILSRLWTAIGTSPDQLPQGVHSSGRFQVQFVPFLVRDILTLCLSHHDELRTGAVSILFSMIVNEYNLHQEFTVIEGQVIDCLDQLFMQNTKGDEISRSFFIGQLQSLAEESVIDEQLRNQISTFLISVNSFLDLLLAILDLPLGAEFQEDRIISTLKLMNFVRGIGRSEIYVRYVDRLYSFHIALGDEVEAALTLKLRADLHEWDLTTYAEPIVELDLPRQTDFARKETLYMRMLGHLGKGQAYEIAISICKELQVQYETKSFNYSRLAELLTLQSELYSKIVTSERRFGEYFRVAFYGNGFPASINGKQFVHRAALGMKLGQFIERMLSKHPGAQLLRTSTIPSDDIQFSEGQHLQITSVQPEPDQQSPLFTNPDVPHAVKEYYLRNETHTLSFSRSINRGEPGDNSYISTWTEKTTLICEDSFPTILRRSEVVEISISDISPIENALNDVEAKQTELNGLEHRYKSLGRAHFEADRKINTNILSMSLNKIVDTPVDQGVPMYRSIFLESDYLLNNPGQGKIVHALASAIDELVSSVARCLNLHAILCPPEMQPFHDTLVQFFSKNFASEIARLPGVSITKTSAALAHPNFPSIIATPPSIFHTRNDSIISAVSNHTITSLPATPQSKSPQSLGTSSVSPPVLNGRSAGENSSMASPSPIPLNGISPKSKKSTSSKNRGSVLGSLRWKKKDVIEEGI